MKSLQTKKSSISLRIIAVEVPARMLPIIVKLANLKVSPTDKMPTQGKNYKKNDFTCNKISMIRNF
ncbi:MAG: hypothetical protein RI100_03390 [Nitrosarchaeum sp.]|jgi:hypothetical protein|uniref:hypothetical protein n=1 Tax=Nitrosarchaeum sp. TaxID=2026886 RepID=UPI002DF22E33|nr:hypothetical protein [Nitrosarchaeum sp.]